ncbi:MAG: T9SS type A sorting domain-containing protein [Paludibacter sp.]|nr:T9SS type A sorting domain-containing protein [Paludibacter sp.]
MKKVFTLVIALLGLYAMLQPVAALTYNVTVPVGTDACYIVGGMNNWSFNNRMTKVDATHFTIDLPNAKETDEYKYWSGPDWKYEEADAQGQKREKNRTWQENDVVESWLEVFKLDERDVTIDVLAPAEVKVLYIVGAFDNWASPSEAYKMDFVSEDVNGKIFSKTVHSIDAINMEFKFCAGPAWSYEQTDPSTNYKYGTTESSTAVVVNAFKAIYDPDKTGTINITATVPVGTDSVWIMGDFLGWNMDNAMKATKNQDGTFSFAIPMVMSIEYRLYNKPDWGYPEVGEADPTKELPNRSAVYPADANTNITVWGWKQEISGLPQLNFNYYKIYSIDKRVVVEGVKSDVLLFDMSGRLLQSKKLNGTFSSGNLSSGLYILRVDNAVSKVSVR